MSGRHLTPDEVLAALADGRDDDLIGVYESAEVDFKGQYRLEEPKEKWELAKDIAAFANARGGLIAVGLTTSMDEDRAEEIVEAVRPVPLNLFVPKQVYDIAAQWIYPPPQINVIRYPRGDSSALGSIEVLHTEADAPYLVTRMHDANERPIPQVAFGWPVRYGTQTTWTPVGQVHRHLSMASAASTESPGPPTADPVNARDWSADLDELEVELGWSERAILYVAAGPTGGPQQLADFYKSTGVLGAVQRPFRLRALVLALPMAPESTQISKGVSRASKRNEPFASTGMVQLSPPCRRLPISSHVPEAHSTSPSLNPDGSIRSS